MNKIRSCRGLGCTSTDLIRAHIMPRGIAKHVKRSGDHVVEVTKRGAVRAAAQHGEFDDQILCETCDGKLGIFDNYALTACRNFQGRHRNLQNLIFEMPNVSGDQFAKFALACVWRASISKRSSLKEIALGPYEELARDVLFGAQPLTALKQFQVLVQRYTSPHMDVEGFYTLPVRSPFGALNAYGFAVAGFRITAKIDNRPFEKKFDPFVINDKSVLTEFLVEVETTTEFKTLADIAVAQIRREGKAKRL